MSLVTISTYNILSSELECNLLSTPYLSITSRLPKILSSLNEMISMDAIIGLQEVTDKIYDILISHFDTRGYDILYCSYRNHGNIIAYPRTYKLLSSNIIMIGNTIKNNCTSEEISSAYPEKDRKGLPTKRKSAYVEAIKRNNALLHIKLFIDDKIVNIFNYHLPLCFQWLPVMGLHITTLLSEIYRLSSDEPTILLTDLNNNMNTSIYQYIINKRRDVRKGMYPSPLWKPFNEYHLIDARRVIDNKNIITAYSLDPQGNEYKGCLDYIFISEHFTPYYLYQRTIDQPIPNQYEGSDHIPVIMSLEINY